MASGGDQHWSTLKAIFAEAMMRPPDAREAFLQERCGGDEALLAELLDLVRASSETDVGLRDIVADAAGEITAADGMRRLGPYRLVRRIGEGGMGTVWLAERADDQYRKQVALKILRAGGDASLVSRFRTERQLLADLDHPNIARLFDGGETEDGRPWLAMEYVEGLPITDYCDRHGLDIEARLRLFLDCCRAVQHAHRRLIIHRDVKPSNILVDERGTPYLLDFGIAKLLQAGELQHTIAVTQDAARIMTPGHASPEQVRGETVTTATDIYSLGILLYQLLSGHFPYPLERSTAAELERAICEQEPAKPSSRVTAEQPAAQGETEDAADVGRARGTTVGRLRRELSGDLDNIVMMALRKEPDRRYESVSALMADVRAYLTSRPVSARADSAGYRLGKFLRRNTAGVAAAAGVLLVIAGLVGYYTWQLAAERDRARTEARVANQATDFVVTLFNAANPKMTNPGEISPRSLLEEGRRRIDEELAGAPRVRGRLLGVLGQAYHSMGDHDTAIALGREAVTIYDEVYADRPAEAARAKAALAQSLAQAGQREEAAALFEEALAALRADADADDGALSSTLNRYGRLLRELGEYDRAEALLGEVLAMVETGRDVSERTSVAALVNIGTVLAGKSRYAEALEYLKRAEARYAQIGGSADYSRAALYLSMGNYESRLGNAEAALAHLDRAVMLMKRTLGSEHEDYAAARLARSNVLGLLDRDDEAEAEIRAALAVQRRALGPDDARVGLNHHYLGSFLWRKRGEYEAAVGEYRQALSIYEAGLKADHPYKVFTLNAIGSIRLAQERYDEAVQRFGEALALAETGLPPDHQQVVYAYRELGRVYRERGDHEQARAWFEKGLDQARRDGSYPYTFEPLLQDYAELADEIGDENLANRLREQLAELDEGS
jgi:serine/threonine-protein kinase